MSVRSRILPAVLACALAAGAATAVPASAQLASGPIYRQILQPGASESSVIVSWRTHATRAKEFLEVAPTSDPGAVQRFPAQEKNAGRILYKSNFATATGLEENTEYTYRVGSDEGGWSQPETFSTRSFGDDWSFLTVSDAQIGVNLGYDAQTKQWNTTLRNAVADVPEAGFVWSLGDQVEGWGDIFGEYERFFSAPALRRIPTSALAGNHESYPSPLELTHYDEHFINPNQDTASRDFYFTRNNVLFIGLESDHADPAKVAHHADFVRQTVAEHGADKDWIIVGMHHAFFSQGDHYLDSDVKLLRESLAPVFSEVGVDAVLSGHDHIYTRTHLMNGTTPVTPAQAPARGDRLSPGEGEVLYLTTTTAGGGKYYDFADEQGKAYPKARMEHIDPSLPHASTAFRRQDYNPDYMRVDVSNNELTFTTYNANDPSVVDKVTLINRDPKTALPADATSAAAPTAAPTTAATTAPTKAPTTSPSSAATAAPHTTSAAAPAQSPAPVTSPGANSTPVTAPATATSEAQTTAPATAPASSTSVAPVPSTSAAPAESSENQNESSMSSTSGIILGIIGAVVTSLGLAGWALRTFHAKLPEPLRRIVERFL